MNNDLAFLKELTSADDLLFLQETKKINKYDSDEWQQLKVSYKVTDSISRVLLSIINSIMYQRRVYFMMTRDLIQHMVKTDKNHIEKNKGFRNGKWSHILLRAYKQNIFELVGVKNKISIYKLIKPELLNYIIINEKNQLDQCIDYIDFISSKNKSGDVTGDVTGDVDTKERGHKETKIISKEETKIISKEEKKAFSNKELSTKLECKMSLSEEIKLDSNLIGNLMNASIRIGNPNYSEYKTFIEYEKLLEEIYNMNIIKNVNEKKLIIDFIIQSAINTLDDPSFKKLKHSAKMKKGSLVK